MSGLHLPALMQSAMNYVTDAFLVNGDERVWFSAEANV